MPCPCCARRAWARPRPDDCAGRPKGQRQGFCRGRTGNRPPAGPRPVTQTLLATPEDRSSIFPDSAAGKLGMIPTNGAQAATALGFNDLRVTGPATCRTLASAQMPLLVWVECRRTRTLPISFRSNIPTSPRECLHLLDRSYDIAAEFRSELPLDSTCHGKRLNMASA